MKLKTNYHQCNSATVTEVVLIAIEGFLSLDYSILKIYWIKKLIRLLKHVVKALSSLFIEFRKNMRVT